MSLQVQINSFIFSFFFGIIFSMCTNLNYRFLFSKKLGFKILFTIIYIFDFSLLYFIIMKKINYGIIHEYFLISLGIGYIISSIYFDKKINNLKQSVKRKLKKVSIKRKNI